MEIQNKLRLFYLWTAIILVLSITVPGKVSGEVKPIEVAQEKLMGISKEEQKTLEELFSLTQEIEEMEREEARLNGEIGVLEARLSELDMSIEKEQKEYDDNLYILEQVLVSYQRGGPASYLELLLKSEDLSAFLKNINLVKDISKNVAMLLETIEEGKRKLTQEKEKLASETLLLEEKKEELKKPMEEKRRLVDEREAYMAALAEEKELYEEHLANLELMWADIKEIFSSIVGEFSRIIGEGHFTMEDLNLSFHLFSVEGSVSEATFNRILKEHSTLPEIEFHFNSENIVIEVPDKNLILYGRFSVSGKSALLFEAEGGSFYGMPLEPASIDELFKDGPLLIDFEAVAGDLVLIEINLQTVEAKDGNLIFTIKAGLSF